jgi:uncharacterized repeat protein (TIGR03833 family)
MRRAQRNQQHRPATAAASSGSGLLIGKAVSVVQKQDQGTGRLTNGIVAEVLTNSSSHPRGMKVRLTDGTVGRISNGNGQSDGNNYSDDVDEFEYAPPGRPGPSLADFMTPATASRTRTKKTATKTATKTTSLSQSARIQEWPCQICTFVNSGLLSECEMCQTVRDS